MRTDYIDDTWWFEQDWNFRVKKVSKKPDRKKPIIFGIPQSVDLIPDFEHEGTNIPVLLLSDEKGNTFVLAMRNVLRNTKAPSDAHALWKSLFTKSAVMKPDVEAAGNAV